MRRWKTMRGTDAGQSLVETRRKTVPFQRATESLFGMRGGKLLRLENGGRVDARGGNDKGSATASAEETNNMFKRVETLNGMVKDDECGYRTRPRCFQREAVADQTWANWLSTVCECSPRRFLIRFALEGLDVQATGETPETGPAPGRHCQ